MATVLQPAKQQFFRQRLLHLLLDQARHGACAIQRLKAGLSEPAACHRGEFERHVLIGELFLQLPDELVYDPLYLCQGQMVELNPGIESIAKLRAESTFDGVLRFTGLGVWTVVTTSMRRMGGSAKADLLVGQVTCASVGRHNQDDIAK